MSNDASANDSTDKSTITYAATANIAADNASTTIAI